MDDDRGVSEGPSDASDPPPGASSPSPPTPPDLRVGDADRQAALAALGTHLEAGRLDVDEYGDRAARAAVAVRRGELVALFDDLPAPHPALPERPGAVVVAPVAPESSAVRHREHDHAAAASFALFLMLMIALPALVYAAGVAGVGGGLLFLPLIVLLAGGSRHARRGFGPGGPHGRRGRGRRHG